jgi:hypothetical protein
MQQRDRPVKILRRVRRLSYEIKLPNRINRVYPVISVAQLKSTPKNKDPYDRLISTNPGPVVENTQVISNIYEIESLRDKKWIFENGK